MASKVVTSRIRWCPAEAGGRAAPPGGSRYVTVSSFDPPTPNWPEEAWSLVIEPIGPRHFAPEGTCAVHFLAREAAPHHVLRRGTRFQLLEGKRVVADGVVLDDTYDQFLARTGVSLQQLGLADIALQREDALVAVEILQRQATPILGGDVYLVQDSRTEIAHANWHSDRRADEALDDYIIRSCQETRTYIEAFPRRDGVTPVFVLVV
jgi:hypothetical protein